MKKEPHLPETFTKLIELIGWDGAVAFTRRYGGTRVYMPKTMTPEHDFAQLIGFAPAQALVREFGGVDSIPIPRAGVRAARNIAIRAAHTAGKSYEKLALEFGLTHVQVYNICREGEPVEAENRQMELIGG